MEKKYSPWGYDILVTHSIALAFTAQVLEKEKKQLLARYPSRFLLPKDVVGVAETKGYFPSLSSIYYLEEIVKYGIFGALWNLGEALSCGFLVELSKIPVEQRTIEICEWVRVNPYLADSSGTFLFVSAFGQTVLSELAEQAIPAAIIGRITKEKARIIKNREEIRFLTPNFKHNLGRE